MQLTRAGFFGLPPIVQAALMMTGGAAVKLAGITDLPFETIDALIFEGLLELQSHRLAL
jgi:type III pantothenate kinase